MPELPEVETVKNELAPEVIGRRITGVSVLWPPMVLTPSLEQFQKQITGQEIKSLARRGKHLIFNLSSGQALIVHLRMTGSLLIKPAEEEPEKSIRAIIYLDNSRAIHFRDSRKFGKIWLVGDKDMVVGQLGQEPLDPEFTPEVLAQILKGRNMPIKVLLLEQTLIAGIGNMYADEALFHARISPLRPANSLTTAEIKSLHRAIQKVLKMGIKNKGASTETYIRPDGSLGTAHHQFQVAHQAGKPCPAGCKGKVVRISLRGRGTFFCPDCQH